MWVEPISGITGKYLFFLHNIIQKNAFATFFLLLGIEFLELILYKKSGTFSKSSGKWDKIREMLSTGIDNSMAFTCDFLGGGLYIIAGKSLNNLILLLNTSYISVYSGSFDRFRLKFKKFMALDAHYHQMGIKPLKSAYRYFLDQSKLYVEKSEVAFFLVL